MTNRRLLNVLGLMVVLLAITPALTTSSAGRWTQATNMSDWQAALEPHWMRISDDGTQVVYWIAFDLVGPKGAIHARVRPPGGSWGQVEDITGWMTGTWNLNFWKVVVGPDGTAWAVWAIYDPGQPAVSRFKMKAAQRLPDGTWQSEDWTGWLAQVRFVDLSVGPDGDLVAAWVACNTTSPTLSDGPCYVNARRRPAGATAWGSTQQLNGPPGPDGVDEAYALVGPGGLAVVVWDQVNPFPTSQWRVMANAFNPLTGFWDISQTPVSGFVEPRNVGNWLAQPVMDPGGTVVAAWTAKTPPALLQDAQYSSTRAASTGTWSLPAQIAAPNNANSFGEPRLAVGQNGAVVAAWEWENASSQYAIFANARDPGGTWSGELQVSTSLVSSVSLRDLDVWPDGTAMVLWEEKDTTRPADVDEALWWSARTPSSTWGSGGDGQLWGWGKAVSGAALELSSDGTGTVAWGVEDANQPTNQQGAVLAAHWPSAGPWDTPTTILEGYKGAYVWYEGLAAGPGGRSVGAAFLVWRHVVAPTPGVAIFYSGWQRKALYLPIVMRQSP